MAMQKIKDCYIVDDFEGWDGDAVYELDDGSKWELVSYHIRTLTSTDPGLESGEMGVGIT